MNIKVNEKKMKATSHRWRFLAAAAGLHLLLEDLEFVTTSQCNAPHKSAKHLPWLWIQINHTSNEIAEKIFSD